MTEAFLIGLLFLLFLACCGAMLFVWRRTRDRLNAQDQKLSESLDDLDLVEFQESVQALLEELKTSTDALLKAAEERAKALKSESEKAKELERRLADRVARLEKQLAKADDLYRALEARKPAKAAAKEHAPAAKPAKAARPARPHPAPAKTLAREFGVAQAPTQPLPEPEELDMRVFAAPAAEAPAAPQPDETPEAQARDDETESRNKTGAGKYAHVFAMAQQGMSVEQIARAAHLLPGEVQLILRLKRKG